MTSFTSPKRFGMLIIQKTHHTQKPNQKVCVKIYSHEINYTSIFFCTFKEIKLAEMWKI